MQNQQANTTQAAMYSKRKHERQELIQPIPVLDSLQGESLGALVNLTIEGLMIMSNHAMQSNRIYQITLQLPTAIDGIDSIELGVDCLWTRGEEQYDRYWSGFQIIDASQTAIKIIESLIRDYGNPTHENSTAI